MSRLEKALENALNRRGRLEDGGRLRPVQVPAKTRRSGQTEAVPPATVDAPKISSSSDSKPVFPQKSVVVDMTRLSPYLQAVLEADSPYAEAYRKIRTNILARTAEGAAGAFLVTSSAAAEGKSLTALNLALLLAQGVDQTVLLVDADLRKPSVNRYLGIESGPGLADYLRDASVSLSDVLVHTGLGKLVVLPAGSTAGNPSELLLSRRMQSLVRELRSRYPDRLILFDSAPLLAAAETVTMAAWTDGVVFVVREGVTTLKVARAGFELIRDCRVVGTVINAAATFGGTAGYGGYDGYSYGASASARDKT